MMLNKKRLDVKDDADHRFPANSRHQTEQQKKETIENEDRSKGRIIN